MTVQKLYDLQARLENVAASTQTLSAHVAKIRSLKYGIENQSRNYDEEIILTKTKLKIDIDKTIVELTAIREHIS
jgi:hypothetical protein